MRGRTDRPILRISPSPTDVVVEIAAAAVVAYLIFTAVYTWPRLPDRIPTHFSFLGKPDAWGPKSALLILPVLGVAMYVLLTIVARFPHTFNYPTPITPENAERQYRIGVSMLRWLKLETICLLAYINWQTVQVSLGRAGDLGALGVPLLVLILLATILIYVLQAYRAR